MNLVEACWHGLALNLKGGLILARVPSSMVDEFTWMPWIPRIIAHIDIGMIVVGLGFVGGM